jgi:hypothetical protein
MSPNFIEKTILLYREAVNHPIDGQRRVTDLSVSLKNNNFKDLITAFSGTPVIKNYIRAIKESNDHFDAGFMVEIDGSGLNLELKKDNTVLAKSSFLPFNLLKKTLKGNYSLDKERDILLDLFLFDPKTVLILNFINMMNKISNKS